MRNRRGFTLVELMVVVAIIGLLAAIAIPNFVTMQLRAKRAELPTNISGIKVSEMAHDAAFDVFVNAATPMPDASPGKTARPWVYPSDFDTLGWAPDGVVRGSYAVVTLSTIDFLISGFSDIDGNTATALYTATRTTNVVQVTPETTY